jgi:hypothetical protein
MVSNTEKSNRLTNGEILIISTAFKHGMACRAVFLNAIEGTVLLTTLE